MTVDRYREPASSSVAPLPLSSDNKVATVPCLLYQNASNNPTIQFPVILAVQIVQSVIVSYPSKSVAVLTV